MNNKEVKDLSIDINDLPVYLSQFTPDEILKLKIPIITIVYSSGEREQYDTAEKFIIFLKSKGLYPEN